MKTKKKKSSKKEVWVLVFPSVSRKGEECWKVEGKDLTDSYTAPSDVIEGKTFSSISAAKKAAKDSRFVFVGVMLLVGPFNK